jgi:hypothetical protein
MNGTEPKIEIFKPFGDAFELMKKILFQPFDLKKWFVIGFAAWLASLGGGCGSFNYQSDRGEEVKKVNDVISQIPHPILVAGIVLVIVLVLVSDCPMCLVASTRGLHVYRLDREEPGRNWRTVA